MLRIVSISIFLILIYEGYTQSPLKTCANERYGHIAKGKKPHTEANLRNYGVIAMDAGYTLDCCGTIKKWRAQVERPGDVVFQVWRRVTPGQDKFMLVGENAANYDKAGKAPFEFPENERISVQPGDFLGWYTKGESIVVYDTGGTHDNLMWQGIPSHSPGVTLDWSGAKKVTKRFYSIEATGAMNNAPKIINLPSTAVFTEDELDGQQKDIFTVEVEDIDPQDLATMKVEILGGSAYFGVRDKSTTIVMTNKPPIGEYNLDIMAIDHCLDSRNSSLKVIIREPLPDLGARTTPVPPTPPPTPAPPPVYDDTEGGPPVDYGDGSTGNASGNASRTGDDWYWDWLVAVIVISSLVILLAILLVFFKWKGWLHKVHRTHPHRRDVEKANGKKPSPKMDDISKAKQTPNSTSVKEAPPSSTVNTTTSNGVSKPKDIKLNSPKPKSTKA